LLGSYLLFPNELHHSTKFSLPFAVEVRHSLEGRSSVYCVNDHEMELFDPLNNAGQAAALCEYYWVSSTIRHDGLWMSCINDLNDDPHFMMCGVSRVTVQMQTLLSALLGDDTVWVPNSGLVLGVRP
jgi:hypothetical protein